MQFNQFRRREFHGVLSGAFACPLAAYAQHGERVRLVGVLMGTTVESEQQAALAVFQKVLQQLGWVDGRNVRIDTRWAGGDAREIRRLAGCQRGDGRGDHEL